MCPNEPTSYNSAALVEMIKRSIEEEIGGERRTPQKYYLTPGIPQYATMKAGAEWGAHVTSPRDKEAWLESEPDLYSKDITETLFNEPQFASYLAQMFHTPDEETARGWISNPAGNQGKGKGILYGVGTVVLLGLLFPSFGRKVQTVLSRTALEGTELLNKARSLVARAKEDIEDLIAEASLEGLTKRLRE